MATPQMPPGWKPYHQQVIQAEVRQSELADQMRGAAFAGLRSRGAPSL
jgi:hypothetical protein